MCLLDVIFNFFLIFPTRELSIAGMEITMPAPDSAFSARRSEQSQPNVCAPAQ